MEEATSSRTVKVYKEKNSIYINRCNMNKYKLLIIICFFLVTLCLPKVTATVNNLNLLGKTIVLDAGHGR